MEEITVLEDGNEWTLTKEESEQLVQHIYYCDSCKFYHLLRDTPDEI